MTVYLLSLINIKVISLGKKGKPLEKKKKAVQKSFHTMGIKTLLS